MSTVVLLLTADELHCVGCAVPRLIRERTYDGEMSTDPRRWGPFKERAFAVSQAAQQVGQGLLPLDIRRQNAVPFAMTEYEADGLEHFLSPLCETGHEQEAYEAFGGLDRHVPTVLATAKRLLDKLQVARKHARGHDNDGRPLVPLEVRMLSGEDMLYLSEALAYYVGPPFTVASRRNFTPMEKVALENALDRMRAVRQMLPRVGRNDSGRQREYRVPFAMTSFELGTINEQLEAVVTEVADKEDDLPSHIHASRDDRPIAKHLAELLDRMFGGTAS